MIEFYELGVNELFPVSAVHGHGVADLLDVVVESFAINDEPEEEKKKKHFKDLERIAIVESDLFGTTT